MSQRPVTELSSLLRISPDATSATESLGALAQLLGTWVGSKGWNLIAVPSGPSGFRLIVRPYTETMVFTPVGALVPNRGGPVPDQMVPAIKYELTIADAETGDPMHMENGMWLVLEGGPKPRIARLGSIPHGDTILALGTAEEDAGPPTIGALDPMPTTGPSTPLGYTDAYLNIEVDGKPLGFQVADFNEPLREALAGQKVVSTTTLAVSTSDGGSLSNTPFIQEHANATDLESVYWIEEVEDPTTGQTRLQLQYSQRLDLHFLPQFGNPVSLIICPHVSTNTLTKQ